MIEVPVLSLSSFLSLNVVKFCFHYVNTLVPIVLLLKNDYPEPCYTNIIYSILVISV